MSCSRPWSPRIYFGHREENTATSRQLRQPKVSVMSAFHFVCQLRQESFLNERDEPLRLVRRNQLLRGWHAAQLRCATELSRARSFQSRANASYQQRGNNGIIHSSFSFRTASMRGVLARNPLQKKAGAKREFQTRFSILDAFFSGHQSAH